MHGGKPLAADATSSHAQPSNVIMPANRTSLLC